MDLSSLSIGCFHCVSVFYLDRAREIRGLTTGLLLPLASPAGLCGVVRCVECRGSLCPLCPCLIPVPSVLRPLSPTWPCLSLPAMTRAVITCSLFETHKRRPPLIYRGGQVVVGHNVGGGGVTNNSLLSVVWAVLFMKRSSDLFSVSVCESYCCGQPWRGILQRGRLCRAHGNRFPSLAAKPALSFKLLHGSYRLRMCLSSSTQPCAIHHLQ